jgi:hypothetical protein
MIPHSVTAAFFARIHEPQHSYSTEPRHMLEAPIRSCDVLGVITTMAVMSIQRKIALMFTGLCTAHLFNTPMRPLISLSNLQHRGHNESPLTRIWRKS